MRSPVLIAEIPTTADAIGSRYLAPPGRGVDAQTAVHYLAQARETGDDIEEIEGEDYLAVRLRRVDEQTGTEAPLFLVLAGIDVAAKAQVRMYWAHADEIVQELLVHMREVKGIRHAELAPFNAIRTVLTGRSTNRLHVGRQPTEFPIPEGTDTALVRAGFATITFLAPVSAANPPYAEAPDFGFES